MTRFFTNEEQTVAQIAVYQDGSCETETVILCVKHKDKLKYRLFVKDKLDKFKENKKPTPTFEKIEDLFIIFDFQKFGESSLLPNGYIRSESEASILEKSAMYYQLVTTCYTLIVTSNGEILSFRTECESSYQWLEVTSGGGGGSFEYVDWYNEHNGGTGSTSAAEEENCICTICEVCGGCLDDPFQYKSLPLPGEGDGETTYECPMCSCIPIPVVYATALKLNPKADCVYQNLLDGKILQDFIARYYAPTEPNQSFLGELNLTWTLGNTTETLPIGVPNNGTYYSVEIRLNESAINSNSVTNVAISILHEALHATLIAEVYDEVGTTNFKTLYAYYKGWGLGNLDNQQEMEMVTEYANEMAQALQTFDQTQGINHTLDFYKEAIKYIFSVEIGVDTYSSGQDEYSTLYYSSINCY